jgi:hypothetical protein
VTISFADLPAFINMLEDSYAEALALKLYDAA